MCFPSTSKICFILGVRVRYGTLATPIPPSSNSTWVNLHEMRILHSHNKVILPSLLIFHKIQIFTINLLYCWFLHWINCATCMVFLLSIGTNSCGLVFGTHALVHIRKLGYPNDLYYHVNFSLVKIIWMTFVRWCILLSLQYM
jgi:hypothetical protein